MPCIAAPDLICVGLIPPLMRPAKRMILRLNDFMSRQRPSQVSKTMAFDRLSTGAFCRLSFADAHPIFIPGGQGDKVSLQERDAAGRDVAAVGNRTKIDRVLAIALLVRVGGDAKADDTDDAQELRQELTPSDCPSSLCCQSHQNWK
jgi:hypothetical protein